MPQLQVQYRFHAIGQVLFASGNLRHSDRPYQFRWVYDCGTHSPRRLLTDALARYQTDDPGDLDLLALSHFDKDHINGVSQLIASRSRVRLLLLPYMPLWQRLFVAFAQGVGPADFEMQFFINPVAYIRDIGRDRVDEIVFVPSSEEPGPSPEQDRLPEGDQPSGERDESWRISREVENPAGREADDFDAMQATGAGASVHMLKAGSALRVANLFEFVPYNDARYAGSVDPTFRAKVEQLTIRVLSNPTTTQGHLKDLKDLYDLQFGKQLRNEISLFLYGGLLATTPLHQRGVDVWTASNSTANHGLHTWWSGRSDRGGAVLYTGDGTLDSPTRLDALVRHLHGARISRLGALQVMHHGSKYNWHQGVADKIAPSISVFCSDPAHRGYQHPHGEVVRDFLPYCPIQVDASRECVMHLRAFI